MVGGRCYADFGQGDNGVGQRSDLRISPPLSFRGLDRAAERDLTFALRPHGGGTVKQQHTR